MFSKPFLVCLFGLLSLISLHSKEIDYSVEVLLNDKPWNVNEFVKAGDLLEVRVESPYPFKTSIWTSPAKFFESLGGEKQVIRYTVTDDDLKTIGSRSKPFLNLSIKFKMWDAPEGRFSVAIPFPLKMPNGYLTEPSRLRELPAETKSLSLKLNSSKEIPLFISKKFSAGQIEFINSSFKRVIELLDNPQYQSCIKEASLRIAPWDGFIESQWQELLKYPIYVSQIDRQESRAQAEANSGSLWKNFFAHIGLREHLPEEINESLINYWSGIIAHELFHTLGHDHPSGSNAANNRELINRYQACSRKL